MKAPKTRDLVTIAFPALSFGSAPTDERDFHVASLAELPLASG